MPAEAFLHDENPYDIKSREGSSKPARFWYPTVLLNLDIKKSLPEIGVEWLFARVVTKSIKNGRMDLEIVILDEGGEIVALRCVFRAILHQPPLANRIGELWTYSCSFTR
jgi:hypothetical protein